MSRSSFYINYVICKSGEYVDNIDWATGFYINYVICK